MKSPSNKVPGTIIIHLAVSGAIYLEDGEWGGTKSLTYYSPS